MTRNLFPVLVSVALFVVPARAIQTSGGYVTTVPTVANWDTGWPAGGSTGWDYVGQVNGIGGVYLGDNWVLTADHVGAGTFTLDGSSYAYVPGSYHGITDANGTADLALFQIATAPALSPLTLSLNAPVPFSETNPGSQVVMIGYGGLNLRSWGLDTVNYVDQSVTPNDYSYVSTDFFTDDGSFTSGTASGTNNATLVGGDSGGGDFIYNPVTQTWELAGINEGVGSGIVDGQSVTISAMVQLSAYQSEIQGITGMGVAPEPETWQLLGIGLAALGGYSRRSFILQQKRRC